MFITQAKELIKNIAREQIRRPVNVPVMLAGSMGIGKTEINEQIANELRKEVDKNFGFVDLRLSSQEPGELIGYPREVEVDGKHGKRKVMTYSEPEWFPEEGTNGIIHLDEYNRAQSDVRNGTMQLVRERRLHLKKLPPGWMIVASINPDNGSYQVEKLGQAQLRRFCLLKVEADVIEWVKWAKQNDVSSVVTSFIAAHKEAFTQREKIDMDQKNSPDNWVMLSRLIKGNLIPKGLEWEVVAGLVGKHYAPSFIKFQEDGYKRPVSGKEILENYNKVSSKFLKQKNDEDYVTMTELVGEIHANDKPTTKAKNNLIKFVNDAKPEIVAAFCSNLPPNYSLELMSLKEFTDKVRSVMEESRK